MRTYTAKTNKSRRTATIRVYDDGKMIAKYRTITMSSDELEQFEYMTSGDIANFLKTKDSYYEVR